jgi:hypothetical protein
MPKYSITHVLILTVYFTLFDDPFFHFKINIVRAVVYLV